MAARNNLYLFAWVCAIALPAGLQGLSSGIEEVRDYLGGYFGAISLYIYFTMTYGIGASFTAYYLFSCYRKSRSLDMLRISRMTPAEAVAGAYAESMRILLPPLACSGALLGAYALVSTARTQSMPISGSDMAAALLLQVLNVMLICAVVLLGFMRNEAPWALLSFMLVMPLNTLPVLVIFMRHVPGWVYVASQVACLACLLALAGLRAAQIWRSGSRLA